MRPPPSPAGVWQRSVAWSLDATVLGSLSLLLSWQLIAPRGCEAADQTTRLLDASGQAMGQAISDGTPLATLSLTLMHDPVLRDSIAGLDAILWSLAWPPVAVFIALSALYHAVFECGKRQATPGQRAVGLYVTDAQHRRLDPLRALLRHVAGAASWLTLNVGHLMAAAPPSHLALHDRISHTRLWANDARLPAWAWAWLALIATGFLALNAWWMSNAMATMQAALEHALR